jgi:hypothetical protein
MKPSKFIRELTEERNRTAAKSMEGNRYPQVCIDDLFFCVDSRSAECCGGILARKISEGLSQIGRFSLLQSCEGFYGTEVLVTLVDESFLDHFSETNLKSLLNRFRLHLGISGGGPARAVCVVGGRSHYSMTEADPNLL